MKTTFECHELHDYHAKGTPFSDCALCKRIDKQPLLNRANHGPHNRQGTVGYLDSMLDLKAKELLRNALSYRNSHEYRLYSRIRNLLKSSKGQFIYPLRKQVIVSPTFDVRFP